MNFNMIEKLQVVEKKSLIVIKSKQTEKDLEKYIEELERCVKEGAMLKEEEVAIMLEEYQQNKKSIEITYRIVKKNEKLYEGVLTEWYKSPSKVLGQIFISKRPDIMKTYIEQVKIIGEIHRKYVKKGQVMKIKRMLTTEIYIIEEYEREDSEDTKAMKVESQMRMLTYSIMDTILKSLKRNQ